MRVLVTGGTGFLGSHLVHSLIETGHDVVVLKRPTSNSWRITNILSDISLYDVDKIEYAFKDRHIDAVIHTACCYGRKNESLSTIIETNIVFGMRVLEYASNFNTEIFLNTDTFYQKDLNSYSRSKKQFVEWLKAYAGNIQIVNMKLEHMYGEKDDASKFIPWVINQLQQNVEEIPLTGGIQKLDFIFVSDVVKAYLTVLNQRLLLSKFSEFDVGTGELISVRDFVIELTKRYKQNHQENATRLNFGALPYRDGETMTSDVDTSRLLKLGWAPKIKYITGINKLLEAIAKLNK